MTKAERAHYDRLSRLGCILCRHLGLGSTPAAIHHLREGMGMGQRNDYLHAISLCWRHHQGPEGFHGLGKLAFEERYGIGETGLLELTNKLLESK